MGAHWRLKSKTDRGSGEMRAMFTSFPANYRSNLWYEMSEDSIRLINGSIPIALTILSIYSYVRGLVSRKNNNSIIFFTTLLISSFFVTL